MGFCVPRQPEQHPGGVPITLALCRLGAVAQGRGHRPRPRAGSGDKAQAYRALVVLRAAFLTGSLSLLCFRWCGRLPVRRPLQAVCGLLIGALTGAPFLFAPDRTGLPPTSFVAWLLPFPTRGQPTALKNYLAEAGTGPMLPPRCRR